LTISLGSTVTGKAMIDRSLRVRDDLVADSASYNMLLTTMLRAERGPSVWGNWTLDPVVEPGMVGVIDPLSGAFELHKYGAIPLDVDVVEVVAPATWGYQSSSVTHSADAVTFDGTYVDPSTGTRVTKGLRESWHFDESHTIVSCGTQVGRREVHDAVAAVHEHFELIHRWADRRGYATSQGIIQGFGVITATYEASGVVNLAARRPGQTVSFEGSPVGIATLTGGSDRPEPHARASYRRSTRGGDGDIEAFVHPASPHDAGAGAVPYAFEFMSFSGETALPGWVGPIPSMSVSFHNSGSYVVQCTVAYDTPDATNLRKRVRVGGGLPGLVSLPLDATNVRVSCRFWHVDDWGPRVLLEPVADPMQSWWQGQGSVEIQGWWPGDYAVAWAA
jgi:hypothetical protein